jgi:arylsulfatase A
MTLMRTFLIRYSRSWQSLFCLAGFLCLFAPLREVAAEDPPNFVVIFIDDLGFADIQPFSDRYETPNLDRMAKEGRTFTSFYVASSVCTPSRAALMTGCFPARVDMLTNDLKMDSPNHGVLWPGDRKGLNPEEVTIAEVLNDRGYATACVGKWHLGDQPPFLPTRQGFDHYFGIPFSNDMGSTRSLPPVPLVHGEKVIEELEPAKARGQDLLTKRYTGEALRFLEEQAGQKPFFLYLPHSMVHGPHAASPEFRGKTGKGLYADAVAEVDWSVGQILDKLRELGVAENTLVLFTSDNGGGHFGRLKVPNASNAPYSGGKATPAEGGFRVPTIAWWPGTIEAGSGTDLMASTIDLLPTFASLAGKPFEAKRPIDGVDVSPLFRGDLPEASPRNTFAYYGYFRAEDQGRETEEVLLHAVREGQWKYYPRPTRFLRVDSTDALDIPEGALFDLASDPAEINNVADRNPEVVARLKELAQSYQGELGDEGKPGTGGRKAGYVEEGKPINASK